MIRRHALLAVALLACVLTLALCNSGAASSTHARAAKMSVAQGCVDIKGVVALSQTQPVGAAIYANELRTAKLLRQAAPSVKATDRVSFLGAGRIFEAAGRAKRSVSPTIAPTLDAYGTVIFSYAANVCHLAASTPSAAPVASGAAG